MLGPLAEHRFLTLTQVALLLGVSDASAARRLARLHDARLIRLERVFSGLPPAVQIRSAGLRAIGSTMRPPRRNLNEYRHDVGVAWLWLAARSGRFGELRTLVSDRRMRADDGAAVAGGLEPAWGLRLWLSAARGRERHYPDLLMDTVNGHRVAVELELTVKSRSRMGAIMSAYAGDQRIDHVLYLVAGAQAAANVSAAARLAGISARVEVQRVAANRISGAEIGSSAAGSRRARARYGAGRTGVER